MSSRDTGFSHPEEFALGYISVRECGEWFAPCYEELKLFKIKSPAVETFCRLHEAGFLYPDLDDFCSTAEICKNFIDGRFNDWSKLHGTRDGLAKGKIAITPYDEKIGIIGNPELSFRDAHILKLIDAECFETAIQLLEFIEKNTDESGCVLIPPSQRMKIKEFIGIVDEVASQSLRPQP